MPRRQEHAFVSLLIPLAIFFFASAKIAYSLQFIISSILCVFGGLAPDILDPMRIYPYYTHRAFFHSQRVLLVVGVIFAVVFIFWYFFIKSDILLYFGSFIFGYILHLLLDARTKMGLPKK